MARRPGVTAERVGEIAGGGAGAIVGVVTSEYLAGFTAKTVGVTGGTAFGLKALIKGLLFGLFYGVSFIVPGVGGLLLLIAGFSSLGTIALDAFKWAVPGGIDVVSERAAVKVRKAVLGAEEVAKELKKLEVKVHKVEPSGVEVAPEIRRGIG